MAATTNLAVLLVFVINVVFVRGQWLIDYDDSDYDYDGELFHQYSWVVIMPVTANALYWEDHGLRLQLCVLVDSEIATSRSVLISEIQETFRVGKR